jgi:hypothetical protein
MKYRNSEFPASNKENTNNIKFLENIQNKTILLNKNNKNSLSMLNINGQINMN